MDRGVPVTADRDYGPKGNSYAIYVSGTYDVSKKLALTVGARYSLDKRDWYVDNLLNVGGFQLIPFKENLENSWSDISPKLGIDYRITDDAFAYASITKGYKAGGWNGLSVTRSAFDPEYVWAYEAGAKTDWLKKRFRVNLALFYYDYQDMQAFAFGPDPGGAVSITIRNATDSEVYGGELEIMARPLSSLSLGTSVSLARGVYGSYLTSDLYGNIINREGEKFDTPEWSVNAFVSYIIPLKNYGFVNFNANYNWKSAGYDDGVDSEILRIDPRGILNARIMFETVNGKWFLDLYGRNLTDERYWVIFLNDSGIGPATPDNPLGTVTSDARNFGIRLGYRF